MSTRPEEAIKTARRDPFVFISHSRVKEGKVEAFRDFIGTNTPLLETGKPGPLAFLAYPDERSTTVTIIHAFAGPGDFAEPASWATGSCSFVPNVCPWTRQVRAAGGTIRRGGWSSNQPGSVAAVASWFVRRWLSRTALRRSRAPRFGCGADKRRPAKIEPNHSALRHTYQTVHTTGILHGSTQIGTLVWPRTRRRDAMTEHGQR